MKIATFSATKPTPPDRVAAPSQLSRTAKARWRSLADEYGISDAGGLAILLLHCQAFETAAAAAAVLATEGVTSTDRFGQARAHPAATILRDSRAQMLSTLRALNLDVVPKHDRPGRPTGA